MGSIPRNSCPLTSLKTGEERVAVNTPKKTLRKKKQDNGIAKSKPSQNRKEILKPGIFQAISCKRLILELLACFKTLLSFPETTILTQ